MIFYAIILIKAKKPLSLFNLATNHAARAEYLFPNRSNQFIAYEHLKDGLNALFSGKIHQIPDSRFRKKLK